MNDGYFITCPTGDFYCDTDHLKSPIGCFVILNGVFREKLCYADSLIKNELCLLCE